ncbi:hypothetical protein TNCV_3848881 [Trichonephila clavipes]|uniref:Uncharacterized protein n=1 Tax=Trichonephila clavipes TaxID=2585209 RepID=A0A8X6UWE2_TRICX|nr:hypothetical protein TNCV_3848881 [Trichonephila clavipes]
MRNVVIILIPAHHHDSPVSQIFDPDIASDQRSKRTSKVKTTPAQRRKKARIQSTRESPSLVHYQDEIQ